MDADSPPLVERREVRARTSQHRRHDGVGLSSTTEAALKKLAVGLVIAVALVGSSAAWADTSGPQSFTIVQLNGQQGRVFAGGPIVGTGVDVIESEDEGADGSIQFVDRFVFGRGTVTVGGVGTATGTFDDLTCVGRRHLSGSFQILGGTGSFIGASGPGRWTGDVTFVLRRGLEGCVDEELFSTVIFRFTGTATVVGNAA